MDAREKAGRREASAERRAAVYETLLDAQNEVGLGFLLLDDTTFSVISLNEAYCRITGYTEAELRAKPSLMALAEPTEAAVWRHLSERAAAGEVPRIFETALIHKNGQRVEVEVSSKRALLEGRGVIVSLVRDITEQKRAVEASCSSKRRRRRRTWAPGNGT